MKRIKKFIIIILLLNFILTNIFYTVNAATITEDMISDSINNLNTILKNKIDTSNPNYVTEILDENNKVPAYQYYPNHVESRSIKILKAYDNKIFMGVGDWNDNTGPVKMIYYDTIDGKVKSSGTIADEAVQQFTIIDDTLYTTGCDPRAGWGEGSYYTYNKKENKWEQHLKKDGWIHVFNIVEFKDKLFMCGSTTDTSKRSIVQFSDDNGETFKDISLIKNGKVLPYNSELRCYNLVVNNNKLYAYIYYSPYTGIYEYDEEKNEFNHISVIPNRSMSLGGLSDLKTYNYIYFTHSVFKNELIYPSGDTLYKSKDLKKFESVKIGSSLYTQDVIVCDDTLYTLSYKENIDRTFKTIIHSTKDLSDFELVYEFTTYTPPFSLEYYDNIFYIGTGYYSKKVSTELADQNGSLYKIDLKNAKSSLKLNKDNKTIDIFDGIKTNSVEYDISNNDVVFKTNLIFNNTMTQNDWKQEYAKIKNLSLVFSTIADSQGADFNKSASYFNDVISKNNKMSAKTYASGTEFAKDLFAEDLNIQDKLFNITSTNVSSTEDKYEAQITLTINNDGDYSDMKPTINNDDTNNNNVSVNESVDITENNVSINDSTASSDVENNANSISKIPQAGKIFEIKDILQIIIIIAVLGIVFSIKKEKE